jgi:PIN domain nuclease of toxin-antitoxin system
MAIAAAELEWAHRDPADRLIVAAALEHRAALVTRDRTIRDFAAVTTTW